MPIDLRDFRFRFEEAWVGLTANHWKNTHPFKIGTADLDGNNLVLRGHEVNKSNSDGRDVSYSFNMKTWKDADGVSVDFECPKLGMMNFGPICGYVYRIPARQSRKGLRTAYLGTTLLPSSAILNAFALMPHEWHSLNKRVWYIFNAPKIRARMHNNIADVLDGTALARTLSQNFSIYIDPSQESPAIAYKQLKAGRYDVESGNVVLNRDAHMLLPVIREQCPKLNVRVE